MTSGFKPLWGRRGRHRMVVAFTATCVINAYRYKVVSSNPVDGEVHSLSVTCDRSVVFSEYSGFLHQ